MRILLRVLLCIPVIASTFCHAAGIQIGRTRIIYDAAKKEVALPLQNNDKELPWLIQSWTDTGDGKTHGPFIVTPPLFRLDPQKEQSLRITWNGTTLAGDKESLFYMNVRTVPATATDEGDKNVLRLIYKTRLKLFWRPVGLSGTPSESCKNLRFARHGQQLTVINKGRSTASLIHLRWERTKWRKPTWLPLNPALTFLSLTMLRERASPGAA